MQSTATKKLGAARREWVIRTSPSNTQIVLAGPRTGAGERRTPWKRLGATVLQTRRPYHTYVSDASSILGEKPAGWPSIRAKALSRTNISSAVPEHRVLPERLRTKALEISR